MDQFAVNIAKELADEENEFIIKRFSWPTKTE